MVQPWLADYSDKALPDPTAIAGLGKGNKDEWIWQSLLVALSRKIVTEIIVGLEQMAEEAKSLRKKEAGETEKPFRVGG